MCCTVAAAVDKKACLRTKSGATCSLNHCEYLAIIELLVFQLVGTSVSQKKIPLNNSFLKSLAMIFIYSTNVLYDKIAVMQLWRCCSTVVTWQSVDNKYDYTLYHLLKKSLYLHFLRLILLSSPSEAASSQAVLHFAMFVSESFCCKE